MTWSYDPNDEATWEAEDHMRIWEAQQAAKAAKPKRPEPSPWGPAVQVFIGETEAGGYDSAQLWLAKESAQDLARDEPGEIAWVFEDGALAESYRYDPEDGMEWGAAE